MYPMRKDSNAPPNVLHEYLNLVDWKGLELPSTERRCKLEASVKKFECSPTVLVEWIELKETIAKFQAEICKETSDDGQDTVKTLRTIIWYKRACIRQTTRQPSVAVPPLKKDVKKKLL